MRPSRLPHVPGRAVPKAEEQGVNRQLTLPVRCHSLGGLARSGMVWSRGDVTCVRTLNHQTTACVRYDDQEG